MRPKAWVLMLLRHRTCCTEMRHTQPTSQLIAKFCCYCYVIIYVELTLISPTPDFTSLQWKRVNIIKNGARVRETEWNMVCDVSVFTGKKLFGEGYSGLEYDYRGLIKLYNSVGNYEKVFEYHNVLSNWNRLRDRQFAVADALEDVNTTPQQTQEVVQAFLLAQSLGPTRPCLGWLVDRMTRRREEGKETSGWVLAWCGHDLSPKCDVSVSHRLVTQQIQTSLAAWLTLYAASTHTQTYTRFHGIKKINREDTYQTSSTHSHHQDAVTAFLQQKEDTCLRLGTRKETSDVL